MVTKAPASVLGSEGKSSSMDDTAAWVAYIAPVFSSLALVHSLPNWLQFIRQGGVLDEVSLSMEDLSNPSEMLLHLLSVPIIGVTLLASMVILFAHNSPSAAETMKLSSMEDEAERRVTTSANSVRKVDWLPAKVAVAPAKDTRLEAANDGDGGKAEDEANAARPRLEPGTSLTFDELVKEGRIAEKDLDVRRALHFYQVSSNRIRHSAIF